MDHQDDVEHVVFTPEVFADFKKLFNKAVEEKKESFIFQGKEILVGYALYLIEYIEQEMAQANKPEQKYGESGLGPHMN